MDWKKLIASSVTDDILDSIGLERRASRMGPGIGLFLLGCAVGAGVAMLLTPYTGEQARREITKRFETVKGNITEKVKRGATKVGETAGASTGRREAYAKKST